MDKELSKQIEFMFARLNRVGGHSFPAPGALASTLERFVDKSVTTVDVGVTSEAVTRFATAAIEMWHRSLHSFLISASLTDASPIWASVSGYYSSHYAVRGFAHLFGVFQLHREKRIVYLKKDNNHYVFHIEKKNGNDREHKFYWKHASEHPFLAGDPFFYPNLENLPQSDGAHRNKANYWDHINRFPVFNPLNQEVLTRRIERIANMEFSDVPIPNADSFPDIVSIQVVAYHRIVKFRRALDEILKSKNRFWNVHRKPSWCPDTMTFNVVDPVFVALYARIE